LVRLGRCLMLWGLYFGGALQSWNDFEMWMDTISNLELSHLPPQPNIISTLPLSKQMKAYMI
jgi:hypothetical protein